MTEEIFIKDLSLTDESLNKTDTSKYDINIQISMNDVTYCILDTQKNKYIGLENYSLKEIYNPYKLAECLDEILQQEKWLAGRFNKRRIIYINNKSTLVPVALYDAKEEEAYFSFNHNLEDNEDLYCDKLNNLNAYNLYAVPSVIKSKIRDIFDEYKVHHYLSSLIETLLMLNKNKLTDKNLFVNVNKTSFDIILLDDNKLIYNNTYQYQTAAVLR